MDLFLFACLLLLTVGIIILIVYLVPSESDENVIENPPARYWFWRKDGWNKDLAIGEYKPEVGIYLRQTIKSPQPLWTGCTALEGCVPILDGAYCINGGCLPHINSEIYNNPCCKSTAPQACKAWSTGPIDNADTESEEAIFRIIRQDQCTVFNAICNNRELDDGNIVGWIPDETLPGRCNIVPNPFFSDTLLEIPEIGRDTLLNIPYKFATMKTRVRATNLKSGSRGWGFWNTMGLNNFLTVAWFIQIEGMVPASLLPPTDPPTDPDKLVPYPGGFYCQTTTRSSDKKELPKYSFFKLPDLDEEWHDYEVEWTSQSVRFVRDGKLVHEETKVVPQDYMAFHAWVDNVVFVYDEQSGVASNIPNSFDEDRSQEFAYLKISLDTANK
jgi:hypothetical protein